MDYKTDNHRSRIILVGLAVLFFVIYSLPLANLQILNSPDENANFVFSNVFAKIFDLRIVTDAGDQVRPRSTTYYNGYLVPGSFIGLPLIYGTLQKLSTFNFQLSTVPYLTPLFAILGVLAFFGIIRRIFNQRIALISSLLFFIHPSFWYFSSRTMFPNVLFVSLLLIGLYFLLKNVMPIYKSYANLQIANNSSILQFFNLLISGLCIGLALLVRTSEIVWVGALLIAMLIYRLSTNSESIANLRITNKQSEEAAMRNAREQASTTTENEKQNWPASGRVPRNKDKQLEQNNHAVRFRVQLPSVLAFFVPLVIIFILLFSWNTHLYGSPLSLGYNLEAGQTPVNTYADYTPAFKPAFQLTSVFRLLFPFGFHPRTALNNFFNYFIKIFWWWTVPFLFGLFIYFWQNFLKGFYLRLTHRSHSTPQKIFLYFYIFIFLYLVAFYGSARFTDHSDPDVISIGTSYVRYWLPLYILSLPFIAMFFQNIADLRGKIRGLTRKIFLYFYIFIFLLFLVWNSWFVLAATDESLLAVRATLKSYEPKIEKVLSLTEENSIIIAGSYDKLFWPKRKTAFNLLDPDFLNALPSLVDPHTYNVGVGVYYYSWLPQKDLDYLNERKLKERGLQMIVVAKITEGEKLMKIDLISN